VHIKEEIKGEEMKRMFLVLFAALTLEKDRHLNHPFQKMATLTALFLLELVGLSCCLIQPLDHLLLLLS